MPKYEYIIIVVIVESSFTEFFKFQLHITGGSGNLSTTGGVFEVEVYS
jgi:hypothetical protein